VEAAHAERIDTELERVVRRWQQLPLDRALRASADVRALVQLLADEVADLTGRARCPVPDLGPGVLMDQLRVMVYDHACAEGDGALVADRLTDLRRRLP
jgi:hypothetical protein